MANRAMSDFIGRTFQFYGVVDNHFKLDGVVYEAVEDPSDGYRSSLDRVRIVEDASALPFRDAPLCAVSARSLPDGDLEDNEGVQLVDADGHVWLTFGTKNTHDYYPWFCFEYEPRRG